MRERSGLITMKGNPLTLIGEEIKVGDKAPDFIVVDNDLKTVQFSQLPSKISIIASVPSLDTPVCDLETRRFNQEAGKLGETVRVLTISMDLPFAQKRWCAGAGVDNLVTFSDHRQASFGEAYGMLIKELRLLARAVHIVDATGIVRYIQLVPEQTNEPNYDEVLKAVKELI